MKISGSNEYKEIKTAGMMHGPSWDDNRYFARWLAAALRDGSANAHDYGLGESGVVSVGPIEADGLRKVEKL